MQLEPIEKIKKAIADLRDLPKERVTLEYNMELPAHPEVTAEMMFGVKARFNKDVEEGQIKSTYTY